MNHWLGVVSGLTFGASVVAVSLAARSTARSRGMEWEQLLAELHPLNGKAIELVANEHLNPRKGQLDIEPFELWELVGGTEGLKVMRHNSVIICALAAYAVRWNYEEAIVITEKIRREALIVRKAATRATRYGLGYGIGQMRVPFYLSEATAAYYLMRNRLLALYETSHAGLYTKLAEAL